MSKIKTLLVVLLVPCASLAGTYDFLDRFERSGAYWNPEMARADLPARVSTRATNMSSFYNDIFNDGVLTVFLSYGKDADSPYRAIEAYEMLQELNTQFSLGLSNWSFDGAAGRITFEDKNQGIKVEVQVANERDLFQKAFAKYDVIMYHGHSREGRGPAFREYTNYFRMGSNHRTLEVNALSPYFQNEPIELTGSYPVKTVQIGGQAVSYQYQGGKEGSSYLLPEDYTKNIPGMDKDLKETNFLRDRQLFYFYSCQNYYYWRGPIRSLFSADKKLVFGTSGSGWWGAKPNIVFILSVLRRLANSSAIVSELNATGDCDNCFTSY